MSKRSDPAAFARAAGARDPRNLDDPRSPDPLALDPLIPDLAQAPDSTHALTATATAPAPPAPAPPAPYWNDDDDDEEVPPPPVHYDPADYRWVPVCRKPRADGWTEEKQRRFIETLADTGLVNVAARAVGLSRESAYRLRRAAHGAAFARAWDAARQHAGGLIEDIAFERAIEGTEQEVLNREGDVIATRLVHDNRLLKYLLSHLKPERYGGARSPAAGPRGAAEAEATPAPAPLLEDHLRAMEPALPAPPEEMLDAQTLADELALADLCDGALPHFLREQRKPETPAQRAAAEAAARDARGAAAWEKQSTGGTLSQQEFADLCFHIDPISNARPPCRRRQAAPG